jgi:hypothetical protein
VTTVRRATSDDLDALTTLVHRGSRGDPRAVTMDLLCRGLTFVLEFDAGGLAAAARIRIIDGAARLDFLLVDPDAGAEIEARMIGIAEALATAHGCDALGVATRAD